jgi:uncharacterized damage-inducible protein DinB
MKVEAAATGVDMRAQALMDANAEFVRFIQTCTDDEWLLVCPAEGWTVGAVANHIARGHETVLGWIQTIRDGRDVPGTPEQHDATNASMAAAAAGVTQADAARLANENMAKLSALLTSLTESDLAMRSLFGPAGGMEMSVDQLAGNRGHLERHLASIRETLQRPTTE